MGVDYNGDAKSLEKYKKYLTEHYPNTTDEQREKLIISFYKLANYAFDEYIKDLDNK